MHIRSLSRGLRSGLCLLLAMPMFAFAGSPQNTPEAVIYAFKGGADGANPNSLIAGPGGVLYGTTQADTTPGCASTIFELDPPAVGQTAWTKKTLITFATTLYLAQDTELLRDKSGTLYGVVRNEVGGSSAVFRLSPPAPGHAQWTLAALYTFSTANAAQPAGSLVMDATGALLGVIGGGGTSAGEVFRLQPPSGAGAWTKTVLHAFQGSPDGAGPTGHLAMDASGNFYGMTGRGGSDVGTVFKLSPPAPGGTQWRESVLYRFNGADGNDPVGSLVVDRAGALYGVTYFGGIGDGNIFKLTPPATGQAAWTETVLHRFGGGYDGAAPASGPSIDARGFLYGTASQSGGYYGAGIAYRLDPPYGSRATYGFAVLHAFDGTLFKSTNDSGGGYYVPSPFDGASPTTPPIPVQRPSSTIVLFGVTSQGGTPYNLRNGNGLGVVYEIAP